MMLTLDVGTVRAPSVIDLLRERPPAELRAATDIHTPLELLVIESDQSDFRLSRSVTARVSPALLGDLFPLAPASADKWLIDVIDTIGSFYGVGQGWDGLDAEPPAAEQLAAAEALAALFAVLPERLKPQFSVDALGRPTFAMDVDGVYLHLTVDSSSELTWYAVVRGEEIFSSEVVFDGTALPVDLERALLSEVA